MLDKIISILKTVFLINAIAKKIGKSKVETTTQNPVIVKRGFKGAK